MNRTPSVKIFASYKNEHKIIKSDIIVPIQTGRAIAEHSFFEMIGDDTGENISDRNLKFSELTAQYWAWKNYDKVGAPDYIGFMHYRRHFIFSDKFVQENSNDKNQIYRMGYGCIPLERMDDDYLLKIGMDDRSLIDVIKNYDAIFIKRGDVKYLNVNSLKEDYIKYTIDANESAFDTCMDLVKNLYPDYSAFVDELNNGTLKTFYNMSILRKDIFFECNRFVFNILFHLEKLIDTSYAAENGLRFLGYMGEFLHSLFFLKLSRDKYIKIKEVYSTFVQDTRVETNINPNFDNNFAVLVFSCNYHDLPQACVCIQSIISHSSEKNNYDLILFTEEISEELKIDVISRHERKNIKIRFLSPKVPRESAKLLTNDIYKIIFPIYLKKYKKAAFIDVATIFKVDPMELFDIDIGNCVIGAAFDFSWQGELNMNKEKSKSSLARLNISNPYHYYDCGIFLINIPVYLYNNYYRDIINLCNYNKYSLNDAYNCVLKDKFHVISSQFNFIPINDAHLLGNSILKHLPYKSYLTYKNNLRNYKIIHYAKIKPWVDIFTSQAYVWWQYARTSMFYEALIYKLLPKIEYQRPPFKILTWFKYTKYKILSLILFGNKKKYYTKKANLISNRSKN